MQTFLETLKHPNENGITIFVLGILFILGIYHFLLYFQHRDKAYLFYSLYVFLIFIGLLNRPNHGFIQILIQPIKGFLDHLSLNFILVYNLVYLIFASQLIDLRSESYKWYILFKWIILVLFGYAILLEVLFLVTGDVNYVIKGHIGFTIPAYLAAILYYYPLVKVKSPIKYYLIIGSLFLVLSSIVVSMIKRAGLTPEEQEIRYSIFYLGLIIENIFFALALGHKQKRILTEKNNAKEVLIRQLKANEKLKLKIQEQLKKDIAAISDQAKADKLEKIKSKYDKELAEMKVSALRSQMNPHFIFNSLNSIKRYIIDNEKENAVYYLNKFSKLIRKILSASMEKEISLAEEIETMELYVNIENIRFDNTIQFSINADDELNLNTIKVPSLILQPFLENAIWHGLSLKKDDRSLVVNLEKEGSAFVNIHIIDNGIGRVKSAEIKSKKVHQPNSVGIKLTKERLAMFSIKFKHDYELEIIDLMDDNNTAIGTMVNLKVPLI
ncbi:sensor histidine kinase [Mariniflexile sp.]|uniref:sensor histidine kinase n=1 Tax=Mariniflexile sp. TaxID=1979402 RepID=UPI0040486497